MGSNRFHTIGYASGTITPMQSDGHDLPSMTNYDTPEPINTIRYSRIDPPMEERKENTGDAHVVVRYGIFTD
jgi:hypothetical protein